MDSGNGPKPPWGGFGTFWNFVGQLHDDGGLPQILDRSVMGNRGGSARTELYGALRFLGLIDDEKRPTERLRTLAADPTAQRLRELLEDAYAPVVGLELMTATSSQVGDALVGMGTSPSTITRARTFFLNAAEQAGIPIGNPLKTKRAPSTSVRRRVRPKKKPPAEEDEPTPKAQRGSLPPVIGALVAKLPDGDWTAAEAKQWLGLVAPAIAYDYELDIKELQPSKP
jgi:hypothetical protein